jgi:hypothetical protein
MVLFKNKLFELVFRKNIVKELRKISFKDLLANVLYVRNMLFFLKKILFQKIDFLSHMLGMFLFDY